MVLVITGLGEECTISVLKPSGTLAICSSGSYVNNVAPSVNLMDSYGESRRHLTTNTRRTRLIKPVSAFGKISITYKVIISFCAFYAIHSPIAVELPVCRRLSNWHDKSLNIHM